MTSSDTRSTSFGETKAPSVVDRFGVWLSKRQIRRTVGDLSGKDVADFGCGYNATTMRRYLDVVRTATLLDLSLAADLKSMPNVNAIEGELPGSLAAIPSQSLDVILCMSVIEHLWEPQATLSEFRRLLRPGGVCAINVPSWAGKRALEYSAFRLGLSPAEEMEDHKYYFDPRDLWPLLVKAGFKPSNIKCFRHKFRLNTFALCRVDPEI
jgi:SAM-dependent methyltransferase